LGKEHNGEFTICRENSMKYSKYLYVIAFTCLFSCVEKELLIKRNAYEWLKPVALSSNSEATSGAEIYYNEIPLRFKNVYIEMLDEKDFIVLSDRQYLKLTKKKLKKKYGIVLRAVYPHLGGNYNVLKISDTNDYRVHYFVMGYGISATE
jgi:hypothetical protein